MCALARAAIGPSWAIELGRQLAPLPAASHVTWRSMCYGAMVIKAFNVAEKPSVAKELAHILGRGGARRRAGRSQVSLV